MHVYLLRKFSIGGDGSGTTQPIELEVELEWEVADIHRHRFNHRLKTYQYLVSFVGYDMSEAIWMTELELSNAAELLDDYKQAQGL